MSKRHRDGDQVLPPRAQRRAAARSERHRITTELAEVADQVSGGVEPDDAHDPAVGYRPIHHKDPAKVRQGRRRRRHWKLKMWKRRTAMRMTKAKQARLVALEP